MLLRLHVVVYFFIVSGMGGGTGWELGRTVGGRGTVTLLRKGLEAGEMEGSYETALNISQSKEGSGKEGRSRGGTRPSRCGRVRVRVRVRVRLQWL